MRHRQKVWVEKASAASIKRSALKLAQHILAIKDNDVLPKHIGEILHIIVWKVTEANGKHGTRYISEGVYNGQGPVRHEHVLTRKHLVERMLREPDNVPQVLDTAIGCLVTKEEHHLLTKASRFEGWDRYREAGIRVFDRREQKWIELGKS